MRRILLTALVALSLPAASQSRPSYPLLPRRSAGIVTRNTSEAMLIARLGRANVVFEKDFGFADIAPVGATVLWPKDPARMLRIVWKDPGKRRHPEAVVVYGEGSRWALPNGIKVGTPLARLEQLNGRPFTVTGFDWDYGGSIDFRKGRLDGNTGIDLTMTHGDETHLTEKEQAAITGEHTLKTTDPTVRKAHPFVERIVMDL